MDKSDPSVGTGLVGAPACGDVMKLQIKVDEKTGTIIDAKFKTFGCGSAIASSSYLTTLVKGMRRESGPVPSPSPGPMMLSAVTVEDAGQIRNVDISKELCLPPVKRTFSLFPTCRSGATLTARPPWRPHSALLHARRRRHQGCHRQLPGEKPQGHHHRPRRHLQEIEEGSGGGLSLTVALLSS